MRIASLMLVAVLVAVPSHADAQAADVMNGLRNGGGWLRIPISGGHGQFRSPRIPTAGMTLSGCVAVWPGHSGDWTIDARENVTAGTLSVDLKPGEGARFSHEFGMQAQVDFDFRWSEPRDTTLLLWVGVDMVGEGARDTCEPQYGGG
jgi:hypothetical protein